MTADIFGFKAQRKTGDKAGLGREGEVIARFAPTAKPKDLVKDIEK